MKERNRPIILMAVIFIGGVIHRCFLLHIAVVGNDRYKPHRRSSSSSPSLLFSSFDELCVFFIRMFMLFHLHLSSNRPSQFLRVGRWNWSHQQPDAVVVAATVCFLPPASSGSFLAFLLHLTSDFLTNQQKTAISHLYIRCYHQLLYFLSPMCLFPIRIGLWPSVILPPSHSSTFAFRLYSISGRLTCTTVMGPSSPFHHSQ